RSLLTQERRMGERLARLRDELEESRETLHLTPARVERVVHTALRLARQPALKPAEEPGTWHVPALTGSWAPAAGGLEHPTRPEQVIAAGLRLPSGGRPERLNVGQAEAALAAARDEVVPGPLLDRLVPQMAAAEEALRAALDARAGERARDLASTLARRASED